MNYLDLILAIPLIWGTFNGFRKGLIIEVASVVALFAGIYGAMEFSFLMADLIRENMDWSPRLIQWVSFLLTFILIVFIVHLIARGIQRVVKLAALGMVNRIFGAFFGLIKYLLFVSTILYFVNRADQRYPFVSKNLKTDSFLYEPLSEVVPFIFPKLESYFEMEEIQSIIAAMPGSLIPSRYSMSAPPPVEM